MVEEKECEAEGIEEDDTEDEEDGESGLARSESRDRERACSLRSSEARMDEEDDEADTHLRDEVDRLRFEKGDRGEHEDEEDCDDEDAGEKYPAPNRADKVMLNRVSPAWPRAHRRGDAAFNAVHSFTELCMS